MLAHRLASLTLACGLCLAALAGGACAAPVAAAPEDPARVRHPEPRHAQLSAGAQRWLRQRIARGERLPEWWRPLAAAGAPEPAASRRASGIGGEVQARAGRVALAIPAAGAAAVPTNVPVSDPLADHFGATQADATIAMLGDAGLCAWNDGQGFVTGGDTQGIGYTLNHGASWTDLGAPPAPPGALWTSDPTLAVNEKTGVFLYCALVEFGATSNGIAAVRATLGGGGVTWQAPVVVESVSNGAALLDRPRVAADSSTGIAYLAFTRFFPGGDQVEVRRSTDGGATWGDTPVKLNTTGNDGQVQGPRVAVGPAGEVYALWHQNGAVDQDTFYVKRSADFGITFGNQHTVMGGYLSWGNGAPGYNRTRGALYPALAVDRSSGPHRGRVYVAWNEAFNFYDDVLSLGGAVEESDAGPPNDFFANADTIVVGQRVYGFAATHLPPDRDCYRFQGQQGDNLIFFLDSLSAVLAYRMELFCGDSLTRLARTGAELQDGGDPGLIVFTLPSSGTYYLRVTPLGFTPGGYRIDTGPSPPGPERARDHRDVFVAHSDDGVSWPAPSRVNDDPPWFDDWLPEVAVTAEGYPYVLWYDFRDAAPCGGASHLYLSRSTDGGDTWEANVPVSDVATAWSATTSSTQPNQGDYQGLAAEGLELYPAWADGRLGDPDIYMARWDEGFDCLPPGDVVWTDGTVNDVHYTLSNRAGFAQRVAYRLLSTRAWPGFPITGQVTVPARTDFDLSIGVPVPAAEPAGLNRLELDVWLLDNPAVRDSCDHHLHDATTAVLAAVEDSGAWPDRVEITWRVAAPGVVTVYRAAGAGGSWRPAGQRERDAEGRVRFQDRQVSPGGRYGYRLGVPTASGEAMAGEVWVSVPSATSLGLAAVRPNPTAGQCVVDLTLGDGSAGRLEVLDLAGRRVAAFDLEGRGAGAHRVPLRLAAPPGLYVLRLTQGGGSATARFVVVR